jgi:protein O-mannosyl-transferase
MNPKTHPQKTTTEEKARKAISKITPTHWLPIILLVSVCIAVYLNSLPNGFVYDDHTVIVENKHLPGPFKSFPSLFNKSYFNIAAGEASYRPVATLSYFLIYAAAGLNPFFYHLLSVLLHMGNAVLVYLLVHLIRRQRYTALITALLFACHPALTEAVDCIAYNEDLFAGLFFLLALVFYLKLRKNDLKADSINYGLSLLFFLLGLFSKEMAITLPAIILLYDVCYRNNVDRQTFSLPLILSTIKDRILFYCGYWAVSLFYLCIRFLILSNPQESIKPFHGNLFERIIFLPTHIFSFVKLAVFPLNLTADYVFFYPRHFFAASNLIGFLLIAGLAVGSFFIFRHSKGIFFAIWWFFTTLFPVYNLIPIFNPFAERYLYIPVIGVCLAVAILFNHLFNQRLPETTPLKVFSWGMIIAVLIFYTAITIPRNLDWKNNFSLWSKTVITAPNSSIAHGGLGRAYQDQGKLKDAIREYEKAIELFPDNAKAYYNLGVLYEGQGALKEAVANYKTTIAKNPAFINARFNLANIYHNQGLLEEAIHQYRNITELDPTDFEARNNLGVAYAKQGKLEKATAQWQKVLEIDPQNKGARENIAKAKAMMD